MTERTGGSDVGRTETIAKLGSDGVYRLYGYKYFTSSITSEIAMLLARIEGMKLFIFSESMIFFFIKRFNFELRKSDCRKPFCRVRFRFGFRLIFFFVIKLKQGPNGEKVEGSKGLTTFLIYTHKQGLTFC